MEHHVVETKEVAVAVLEVIENLFLIPLQVVVQFPHKPIP